MSNGDSQVTAETLDALARAWNGHDADSLMCFMSEDCVFEASAGPTCASRDTSAARP